DRVQSCAVVGLLDGGAKGAVSDQIGAVAVENGIVEVVRRVHDEYGRHLQHERVAGSSIEGQIGADRGGEGTGRASGDVGVAGGNGDGAADVVHPGVGQAVVERAAIRLHLGDQEMGRAVKRPVARHVGPVVGVE